MSDLIERLEKATGPDRKHDRAISVWLVENGCDPDGPDKGMHPRLENVPHYTASIDAALTLVPGGFEPHLLAFPHGEHRTYAFEIFPPNGHPAWDEGVVIARGFTPATTVAGAALLARARASRNPPERA